MINESALLESKTLRGNVMDRTDVLDKVKALSLLPDGMHVTTAMMAAYFEVAVETIRQLAKRHREELSGNGMVVLRGADLRTFESDNVSLSMGSNPQARRSLTVYSRRAVLNIAMLLRDSEVARRVRAYLLDMEYLARTQPAGHPIEHTAPTDAVSLDARIDQRIAQTLSQTVVPMFNALIETSSEHHRELLSLRAGVQHIERRLRQHQTRLRKLEGAEAQLPVTKAMAAMDAMTGRQFEEHVASLLRRDGCVDVVVKGGRGDRGVDITARTSDGRRVAVQCKRFAPYLSITSPEIQKFIGASKVLHSCDIALFVATCPFTPDALTIAGEGGVAVVHRGMLDEWSTGTPLKALE
ncbi:restriction endonuclease [Streptomyces sp. NPDC050145]|uniref:restriction endonuclease n=1 Tax=Streptomyces sp. NPDC050145 TaxID=3365602 RepID=UPI00378F586A